MHKQIRSLAVDNEKDYNVCYETDRVHRKELFLKRSMYVFLS